MARPGEFQDVILGQANFSKLNGGVLCLSFFFLANFFSYFIFLRSGNFQRSNFNENLGILWNLHFEELELKDFVDNLVTHCFVFINDRERIPELEAIGIDFVVSPVNLTKSKDLTTSLIQLTGTALTLKT